MLTHDRRRASRGNLAFKRGSHRRGFTTFRHTTNPSTGAKKLGAGDRQRFGRDISGTFEVPFPDLLAEAGRVERDDFHRGGIGEIGVGRVVEGNMSIFAKAHKSNIYGGFAQQGGVPRNFRR